VPSAVLNSKSIFQYLTAIAALPRGCAGTGRGENAAADELFSSSSSRAKVRDISRHRRRQPLSPFAQPQPPNGVNRRQPPMEVYEKIETATRFVSKNVKKRRW